MPDPLDQLVMQVDQASGGAVSTAEATADPILEWIYGALKDMGFGFMDRMDSAGECGDDGDNCFHALWLLEQALGAAEDAASKDGLSKKEKALLRTPRTLYQAFLRSLANATKELNKGRPHEKYRFPAFDVSGRGATLRWVGPLPIKANGRVDMKGHLTIKKAVEADLPKTPKNGGSAAKAKVGAHV